MISSSLNSSSGLSESWESEKLSTSSNGMGSSGDSRGARHLADMGSESGSRTLVNGGQLHWR